MLSRHGCPTTTLCLLPATRPNPPDTSLSRFLYSYKQSLPFQEDRTRASSKRFPSADRIELCSTSGSTPEPATWEPVFSRRGVLLSAAASAMLSFSTAPAPASAAVVDPTLVQLFNQAMSARGNREEAERAWSEAIAFAPDNSATWSNRGTLRLQYGQWQEAAEDLQHALDLELATTGKPNALLLNNLGNARGALGQWDIALQDFLEASKDPEMHSIAMANYALGTFQVGDDKAAIREAKQLLRRDPEFLDVRCALAAFLWASGDEARAESEWDHLQQSGDGLGAMLYGRNKALDRVRPRWPPRATAALDAFLSLSRSSSAVGYDQQLQKYVF